MLSVAMLAQKTTLRAHAEQQDQHGDGYEVVEAADHGLGFGDHVGRELAKVILDRFKVDHDEQGEIIEDRREQGGFGDVEVTRAGTDPPSGRRLSP